jgi:adenosine deaminase
MGTVIGGIRHALERGVRELGITSHLILCFLRHLSEDDALRTLDEALPFREHLTGVGLDSGERDNPPVKFERVFARARSEGLHAVAHAGEEGPPSYVWEALDRLGAERIDHGVRSMEDDALVGRLVREQVPLTVCPFSNVRLRVFDRLSAHPLRRMLERGLRVSIHSDDPAYFGGYVADNYEGVRAELALTDDELVQCARNSFAASFLDDAQRATYLAELDASV